jgi:hypothetical protein
VELLQSSIVQCPYCWERIEVLVDLSVGQQEYVEDCAVCCRPITLSVAQAQDGAPQLDARGEDEA